MKITPIVFLMFVILLFTPHNLRAEVATSYSYFPPFLTSAMPPMVLLTMSKDHRLYYEAYNDASDINEDGELDIRFNPAIDYYGYFDSYMYYSYNSTDTYGRFEPEGKTLNKKVPANLQASQLYWSGNFLNYLTMTRIDCIRRVLYGGYRDTDTPTETVLRRTYIPRDAHSFGKEYESITRDGYDLREYAPFDLPQGGRRHFFGNTTLAKSVDPNELPLLRVITNNAYRIWDWVTTERPSMQDSKVGASTTGTTYASSPSNHIEFDSLASAYAQNALGSGTPSAIDYSGDDSANLPYTTQPDHVLTIITGTLTIPNDESIYKIGVRGDDAIELMADGVVVAADYGAHSAVNPYDSQSLFTTIGSGSHSIVFRHVEDGGSYVGQVWWKKGSDDWTKIPSSAYTNLQANAYSLYTTMDKFDYSVRIHSCKPGLVEQNSRLYPSFEQYKPIGILQKYGEKILFGLLSGSYTKNMSGGVIRKNISSILDEINTDTGQFTNTNGIIATISKFSIQDFRNEPTADGINQKWAYKGDWLKNMPMDEVPTNDRHKFPDWGNPLAEMLYEATRYFSGATTATNNFNYDSSTSTLIDNNINLPLPAWATPFNEDNFCAKPIILAISDIYPSYDADELPGSAWPNTTPINTSLQGLNVNSQMQAISSHESLPSNVFIGQAATYDGACTDKSISGLNNIRGLCPEEPTKKGSYYSAAITHYAATNDINTTITGDQKTISYMVALSSPLPEIKIPVAGNTITLVPFGKSVGGSSISSTTGSFQPTNTIVDFFVESLNATSGSFLINFEDVEQGADHDMDALVRYQYTVDLNSTLSINCTSLKAAGDITQHIGYIISGTTSDGTYLVVRDVPDNTTDAASDPDYYLDSPNVAGVSLPLFSSKTFTPGISGGASLLKNPLWYAAKWGGFEDYNDNGIPDDAQGGVSSEWDADNNGVPDTYFFVANPTKLEEQLNKAFGDILKRTMSGTAASVISQSRSGEGALYQSIFFPELPDYNGKSINWAGQINSLLVDSQGNIREDSNHNTQLDIDTDKIISYDDSDILRYYPNGTLETSSIKITDINFLWTSNEWLNSISNAEVVAQRSQYNATTDNRYIITFADKDNDSIVDTGEIQDFVWPPSPTPNAWLNGTTDYYAYLTLYPSFGDDSSIDPFDADFGTLITKLAERQVDFIRGADQTNSTTIAGYAIPTSRSRKFATSASTNATWRLADTVYSTPTVAGKPSENYNLIYLDSTYANFLKKYNNRRQVIYCGANDGMLHAFNGGFYNSTRKGFDTQYAGEANFSLGQELWGYIPYNLLPHLYWLMDNSYGGDLHVSYMDLKPRIFDARVFFDSSGNPIDTDHPYGWGTMLVAGMRLGGGSIRADVDKNQNQVFNSAEDRVMSSAYVVMDITNPEVPPTVIAELRLPRQGFTTCYPTAMPMSTPNAGSTDPNDWYLVFGSGPANVSGEADPAVINTSISDQNGQLFVVDLKALVQGKTIKAFKTNKELTTITSSSTDAAFATTQSSSFIADPIAVDLNIGDDTSGEFRTDIIYYGTTSGNQTSPSGAMHRLVTNNTLASSTFGTPEVTWTGNTTLSEVSRPITSAPSVAMDRQKNLWVYFGAGRYYNRDDGNQTNHMSFYGIKEPTSGEGNYTWSSVDSGNLFNSTQVTLSGGNCTGGIYDRNCIDVWVNATRWSWDYLVSQLDASPGWRQDFVVDLERVLGQPAVLSGAVLFNTYTPSDNRCEFEGTSDLWGVYYRTGTAYYKPIFRGATDPFTTHIDLGRGMAITPNLHVGENAGSKAFIQTSTGAIETIEIDNPFSTKSGSVFWRENTN